MLAFVPEKNLFIPDSEITVGKRVAKMLNQIFSARGWLRLLKIMRDETSGIAKHLPFLWINDRDIRKSDYCARQQRRCSILFIDVVSNHLPNLFRLILGFDKIFEKF